MAYDLEIHTETDKFFSRDVDRDLPRVGDSYEFEGATRREFVGHYNVVDVKHRGNLFTPTRGILVELKNPLVTIVKKG